MICKQSFGKKGRHLAFTFKQGGELEELESFSQSFFDIAYDVFAIRVADPGGFYPDMDPTFEKKPDPDLTLPFT